MRLLIDGLPVSFGDGELEELLMPYGTVLHATIQKNRNGKSMQLGFVDMATIQGAKHAVTSLNGSSLGEHLLLVLFADQQLVGPIPLNWMRAR